MNNWFNIKRFWLVLRHEFAEAWPELAIFAAVYLVVAFVPVVLFKGDAGQEQVIFSTAAYGVVCIGIILYYWILASRVFANIQRPERKIGYLTLPASNAEKFYSRLLLYWILPLAFGFIPYPHTGTAITDAWIFFFIALLLVVQSSLAVLFGTIFRKGGLLVLILAEVVLTVALVAYFSTNPQAVKNLDLAFVAQIADYVGVTEPDMGRAAKLAFGIAAVPTVFNIGLARIIFSRKRLRRPLVYVEQ